MAFGPNGARLAGRRKIPEPIIVPTTIDQVIQKPSCRLSLLVMRPPWNVTPSGLVRRHQDEQGF
jgi:hypothetical protein